MGEGEGEKGVVEGWWGSGVVERVVGMVEGVYKYLTNLLNLDDRGHRSLYHLLLHRAVRWKP